MLPIYLLCCYFSKKKDLLVGSFATSAGINSLWCIVMRIYKNSVTSRSNADFCHNNAIAISQQAVGEEPSMCVVQG